MTMTEIKKQLTGLNVNFKAGTLKADLEVLLDKAMDDLDKENAELDEKGEELEVEKTEEEKVEEVEIDEKHDEKVNTLVEDAINQEAGSATIWDKTSDLILKHERDFQGDLDKKGRQKLFTKLMDNGVDQSLIPETGLNRKGEEFELRKRGNKIKWASWVVTARIFQNTSDIWKGVELLGWDIVFPSGVIIGRYELLELIKEAEGENKVPELPEDTIARCLDMVMKKIDELPEEAVDSISQRMLDLNVKFSDWKATITV